MTQWQVILLVFFGLVATWFAWRVFMTSSMIRSALSLLAAMVAIGAIFLVLEAEFLGILQIMMMASEMLIMAVFMMMYMMDPGGLGGMDMSHQKKASAAAGLSAAALVVLISLFTPWPPAELPVPPPGRQNYSLGIELMQRSMMIFETAGVTILVGMIASAATVLKYKSK